MRRYGKFVDSVWIHQRMNAKDARFAQRMAAQARQVPAPQFLPTSLPPAKFLIGDLVEVINHARVGEREVVLARGGVEAIEGHYPDQRYHVRGVDQPQSAVTLRLVLRGGAQ